MEEIVPAQNNARNDESGILNVLLHGAFAFTDDRESKHILALMPRLKEHVYRAGSWLAETELRPPDASGQGASYKLVLNCDITFMY
jgi:hypothetical protein